MPRLRCGQLNTGTGNIGRQNKSVFKFCFILLRQSDRVVKFAVQDFRPQISAIWPACQSFKSTNPADCDQDAVGRRLGKNNGASLADVGFRKLVPFNQQRFPQINLKFVFSFKDHKRDVVRF